MVRPCSSRSRSRSSRLNSCKLPLRDDCLAASASLVYAMLLPSGPASTRCSVCRSDSGDLHAQLRSGARNGFAGPRDWESRSTLARPLSAPETARPASEPRKCPQIAGYSLETRKRRFASDCVVGPGGLEPQTRRLCADHRSVPKSPLGKQYTD